MSESNPSSRRRFLKTSVATAAGVVLPTWTLMKGAPAIGIDEGLRCHSMKAAHDQRARVVPDRIGPDDPRYAAPSRGEALAQLAALVDARP